MRSGTVLRARREEIELHTADGLTLVGELALPPDRDPVATLVTLHPLPTHGGFMDSHVLRKASYRLPALADIAVLRFNTRGTTSPRGTSGGAFDEARSERFDVAAAIEYAEFHDLPHRWLLGWSFGTDLALMHGHDPAVEGAILLSPPLRFSRRRAPAGLGRRRQAARRARARARRLPAPGGGGRGGSPRCRRRGSSASRAAGTCGWGRPSCAARWTRSSPSWLRTAGRCRARCRRPWSSPTAQMQPRRRDGPRGRRRRHRPDGAGAEPEAQARRWRGTSTSS